MNKIVFITIYYGQMPAYLNLFLDSASKNPNFDFIIFSEWDKIPYYGDNINYIKLTFENFNQIAISKGIINKPIINTYKLCDLKPAWFHLLEDFDFLNRYDFIGYVDIDMILGNLENFINYDKIKNLDIWTISKVLISGAFTIFRNSQKMKFLYRKAECWQIIFNCPDNLAFDENLHMCPVRELKGEKLISFTDIVYQEKNNGLNLFQEDNIVFEWYDKTIKYNNGKISDSNEKEYISYHYVKVKNHLLWYFPKWKYLPKKFLINKYGFSTQYIGRLNLIKLILIPPYNFNAIKKISPYISRLIYHLTHTDSKSIITTIQDKL